MNRLNKKILASGLGLTDKVFLIYLAELGVADGWVKISMNEIVEDTQLSKSTIFRCVKRLESELVLMVQRCAGTKGEYLSNIYLMNEKEIF